MAVDAGSIYSEVRVALDKLKADLSKVDAQFGKFASTNQQQSTKVQGFWTKSFGKISAGGIAAFAAIGLAVKSAIKTFAGFEQSLANVESVAGATAAEMDELREAALRAGEQTRFTASEAADAMYYLASAGFDASESIAALDGVLALATATQSDLASTSASVAASISQFGLEAGDATLVANVFAAAIGNSQANMEKLTNSMTQVGPVAGAMGISIESTVGALQALYDAGFTGEKAGVGLKNILGSLASESDTTTQKLIAMGLTFEELNPTINSVADIIDNLNAANLEAGEIIGAFGTRTGPQILSLLQAGGDAVREYTDAVTGTNKANEAAATQLDTLQGSFDLLKSAAQSAAIGIVSELAPALRKIVDLIAAAIKWFSGLPGPVKAFVGAATIAIPVIGALAAAVAALSAAAGPFLLIAAGVAGGIAAIASASDKAKQAKVDELFGDVGDRLKTAAENGDDLVETIKEISKETGLSVDEVIELAQEHGLVTSEIQQQVNLLRESNAELEGSERTTRQIVKENEMLAANLAVAANGTANMADVALNYSRNTGFALERIIAIALNLENLSDVQKDQLETLKLQAAEWAQMREDDIASLERASGRAGEREREAAAARAAAEADAEALRIDQLRAAIEDEYRGARAKVIEILEGERTEYEKIREQIDYLNAHKWDEDAPILEADRLRAVEILNQQLTILASQTSEATQAEEGYRQKLIEINAAESDLLALEEARALAEADLYEGSAEEIEKAKEAISAYYDELQRSQEEQAQEAAVAALQKYRDLLEERIELGEDSIEVERRNAIAAVEALGATESATDDAIEAINDYFDFLEQKDAWEEFASNAQIAYDAVTSVFDSISNLYTALADKRIEELDRELEAELERLGVAEETTIESLQRQLAEAIAEGDAETAAELEDELLREQITEEYEKKKAEVEYKAELQAWRWDLLSAIAAAPVAIINAMNTGYGAGFPVGLVLGPALAATAAIATGIQIAAVSAAKPTAPSFQTGGIVVGGSGSAGTNVNVAENGSNELLLNDSSAGLSLLRKFASLVGGYINLPTINLTDTFLINGKPIAENTVSYINNGSVRLNR